MSENENSLEEEMRATDEASESVTGQAAAPSPDGAGAADEATTAEETAEPSLEAQLAAAKAEASKNLDGWQRALADFANARRRLEKQRAEARPEATVSVVKALLPALDDFARALENAPEEIAAAEWFTGLQMVQRKFDSLLSTHNIEKIEALGAQFDPVFHEAIMQQPADDDVESGTVLREFQTGYKLGERVIRPALVVVAA